MGDVSIDRKNLKGMNVKTSQKYRIIGSNVGILKLSNEPLASIKPGLNDYHLSREGPYTMKLVSQLNHHANGQQQNEKHPGSLVADLKICPV